MIAVTLGTHPKPMNRLVLALEELVVRGVLNDDVVITSAAYGARPPHVTTLGIQPYETLRGMIDTARAVITHGGPASIAMAIGAGHTPIIVPRDPAFDEHVDDHQIRFGSWLRLRRPVRVIRDMCDLELALTDVLTLGADRVREPFIADEAITRLRSILASDS